MPNLSANNKKRLVTPAAALVALAAVVALLFVLHSSDQVFAPDTDHPDEISATYSELLLKKSPSNDKLRLSLIDLYLGLARFEKAQHHLPLLQSVDADLKKYYQFKVDAQTALGLSLDTQYMPLRQRLNELKFDVLNTKQQEGLADLALKLDAAPVAALVYESLANTHEAQEQLNYLSLAAQWYFASNQHYKAAELHAVLAENSTGSLRIDYQRLVVADYLAANAPAAAVIYLKTLIEQPDQMLSNEQLAEAVTTALLAADLRQAAAFNRVLIAQDPENLEARLNDVKLSIAAGDIKHAWELRHWLLEHQPDDVDAYLQMASLGEWNHAFAEALDLWIKALELKYDAKRFEHAWRLSIQLFDFERSIALLKSASEQVPLTDLELQAFFYSQESRGTPEQSEQWLRDYIAKYPQHRLGWTYLLVSLENREQYTQESELWSAMAKRFELEPKELIRWAESYLYDSNLEAAWQVLNQSNDAKITDPGYWHLKASTAWVLEDDEQLLLVYQHMEDINITLYRFEVDQLIGLLRTKNPEKVFALISQRWKKERQEQDLMTAVYLAIELNKWGFLQDLVDTNLANSQMAQSVPILFAQASIAERNLQYSVAESVFLQAIELYPLENIFRERLLWLYVSTGQRELLKPLLVQWQVLADNSSTLWLAFAAANQMLNQTNAAIAWYQRYINLNPSDWLVQAAFADALDSAEYFDAALVLRRSLLNTPLLNGASEAGYRTWLNLLAANYEK